MSIHVCECTHNGRTEYHLRYPGMPKRAAQEIADKINSGALTAPAPHPDTHTVVQQMVDALKYYADEPDDLGYDALAAGQKLLKELK